MKKHLKASFLGLVLLACSNLSLASELPKFNIYTEDWSPYQYIEDGQLKGISVDLFDRILNEVGSSQTRDDFQMVPWARGYSHLEQVKNTVLFLTTRTEEREQLFKWVGPVFQNKTYLFTLAEKDITLDETADLPKYRYGTIIDDIGESYLISLGVPMMQFSRSSSSLNNLKMLELGRIDIVIDNIENLVADAKELDKDPHSFKAIKLVDAADVSYAFHLSTSDKVIHQFQQALDQFEQQGYVDELFQQYGIVRY